MAKDDGTPGENPPSKRLREFRKLFNDYTNKGGQKKSSGRRSSASPADSSPVSTPQRRSVARTPRSRNRKEDAGAKSKGAESPADKKKDDEADGAKMAEAKDLAKADDEEFENAAASPSNLAKCKIKQRELQWKPAAEDEKKDDKKKKAEVTEADKQYKSMDKEDAADIAIRRRKSRAPSKKQKSSRRKKTQGSTSSPVTTGGGGSPAAISPAPFNPSAEVLDDLPPKEMDKGVRCRTKKTGDPYRRASPSAESCGEMTTDLQEIDQTSKDFKQAIKLMEIFKRNNLLENALFPAQNEVVKAFFEGGMRNPDNKILGLISKAMDTTLDAVFFRGEDLDCMIDNEQKTFIVDRSKSKPILLDVIISRPEFLPQSWGGRTVVLRAAQAEVNVHIETKREEKR